jgi:hypothetical protein
MNLELKLINFKIVFDPEKKKKKLIKEIKYSKKSFNKSEIFRSTT